MFVIWQKKHEFWRELLPKSRNSFNITDSKAILQRCENEENEAVRVGGVKYTIKDGIVFDSKLLLKDVREIVRKSKDDLKYEIYQPGNKIDFLNTINKTKD